MNWRLVLSCLGAGLGIVQSLWTLVVAYRNTPSMPSVLEILVQLMIVVVVVTVYGIIGWVAGFVLSKLVKRRAP